MENSQVIEGTLPEDQIKDMNDSSTSEEFDDCKGGGLESENISKALSTSLESRDPEKSESARVPPPQPEVISIDDDRQVSLVEEPETKKRPSVKTVNLPKDFG
jgi:hypothetical protein